jgi:tetratricopeptide (TPR) repeat protein
MIGEIFHLDHDGSFVTAVQKYGDKHEAAPFGPWWDSSKPYVNRRDWGLTAAVEVSEGPSAVRLFTPEERGPNLSVICPVPSGAASIERLVATYEHSGAEILLSVEDGVPVPAFDASLVHIVRGRTRTVAINEALARAKGRRICLLATAAECAPRDVAQLMRRFDQDPELMALSCAGTPASNRPASVLLFRRETYERLGGLDELASMPLLEFWRRIQEAGGAEEANVGVRMLSSGGTADWMLDSSIEKEWSELAFGSPGTSDIPCLLLRDYRRRTLRLQGALIARLRVLLPPQTTAVRILGLDAVMTPLLVAAVRQLNLRITAIYTDDAQYAGEIWAGIPIRSAAAIARDDRAPAVLGSQTAADRYAAYSRLPYEQVVNPFAVDAPIGIEASFDFPLSALAEARSLRDDDRVEEAYSVYARMLGLEETDAELQSGVLFEAAHLAARSGRHRVAARLYRRLVRNGAEPRALMAQRLASAYREIGRPDLARRYYNRALRQQKAPPDIEAQIRASCHFHLGELDLQEDRRAQARRHFLRALAAQPSHGKAAAYLRELEAGSPSAEAA